MATRTVDRNVQGVSPHVLGIRAALRTNDPALAAFEVGDLSVEVRSISGAVLAIVRRERRGGVALRLVSLEGPFTCTQERAQPGEAARFRVESPLGLHRITLSTTSDMLERLRATVRFTPAMPLIPAFSPRDLYVLGDDDDPLAAHGRVEATQRGLNTALVYFRLEEPRFGNVLYVQNLTALNDYHKALGTTPKDTAGGQWPELGQRLPPAPDGDEAKVLEAGREVALSDVILVFRADAPPHERESARQFLQMMAAAYAMIELPPTHYRDWIGRAERTLADLHDAPEATIRHYGHRYVHPYTAAEYPDIMVQMTTIAAINDWARWLDEPQPLEAELKAGLEKFYDPKLKTLRRYLPNVGKDKNADAVDSWYLYHPLLNLGLLALRGDEQAHDLFLRSIDYGIRAAHHFDYHWPIQYDVTDFSVIEETAPADGRGQTDVSGVYAWVMLQAFELTDDKRYLDEARAAIDAAMGLRFNVNYQANLTAWGAAACMRLWRITNEAVYLEQSYVYLGSFFHNSVMWESKLGHAEHYETFMGVTCLQDAPYMAIYECFDSFVAFERYMDDSGPDLDPAARMLVGEYCKYALSRAWYYYPDALPSEALAEKQREPNGHIDRKLSFPVEDLYPDGQPAGQVGQEVYGAGAAFIFATRGFHHVEGAPFRLNCDHFLRANERSGDHALSITLDGGETCTANLRLVRLKRRKLPKCTLRTAGGDTIRPVATSADRIDYHVPASGRVILTWE
ncbi:hypothetical protein [Sphingomonas jatrophae]|uniref:Uncharacterized protein n=1 Tax=Sphingomonas jatrophae TaxID=1166337 RepID=A0A1I6K1S9_9SPHN|nr:hypothetical protein [Sphingomonas jatrophae]SFR85189.1 hypothetical protein SAMN05192580_1231 [Sphingomonas jatrophae]